MAVDYSSMEKEDLIKLLNKLEHRAAYGVLFEPQREDFLDERSHHTPLLRMNLDKCIKGNGPEHIFIEGENYHALQILNHTHKQRIDLIYIDPPYNTGNNDFLYNDAFVDVEDSFRHSKWLSFMSRRLKLAKELLKKDGAIVISIDDNEFAQLKLLCDNVFGEDNFVECIPWKKKTPKGVPPRNMMANTHEYLLVYQRSSEFRFIGVPRDPSDYPNDDNDGKGPYANASQNMKSTIKSKHEAFTITDPNTGRTFTDTWAYSEKELNRMIAENEILWPKDDTGQVRAKDYLHGKRNQQKALPSEWISPYSERDGSFPNVQKNTEMFKSMVPSDVQFLNPKPINLMQYLISVSCENDAIILDFFAGSGTTGHAVMNLNAADGGTRRCILCTNNENGIAERITYPRLKAAINGWKQGKNSVAGTNAALAYFQLVYEQDKTTADDTYLNLQNKLDGITRLKHHAFQICGGKKSDTSYDFVIFGGAESTGPVYSVLIFNVHSIPDAVAWFEENGIEENVHFSVFSYGTFAFEEDFPETELDYTVSPYPEHYLVSLDATKKIGV
jgi:adenine-specific DNA-methyltransferase